MSEPPDPARTVDRPTADAEPDAFGPDSGSTLLVGPSVLKALSVQMLDVPRVRLRNRGAACLDRGKRPGVPT